MRRFLLILAAALSLPATVVWAEAHATPAVAPDVVSGAASGAVRATAFASDRIVVETRGTAGPDVILIPGLASTSAVWARTAGALEGRYRVHLVTVRGFGDVAPGGNAEGLVGGPAAAEIRRYIAEKGLERPAVIGHSM